MKNALSLICLAFFVANLQGQNGVISGKVFDESDNSGLPFANITVDEEPTIYNTDSLGFFEFSLPAGYHKLKISYVSFETAILHQVKIDPIKPVFIDVPLNSETNSLQEVVIKGSSLYRTAETPLSIKSIDINEINRLPGTTLDISKVIKNLPGVLPKVSFGYNIIVRGGASHENKFYIDGIEIPSINHFSVQGVSGGPNGIINVDILRNARLITGAFPANRNDALSSVLDLNTRPGRTDRYGGKFTLGATDVGLTVEGPIAKNSNFILSGRKSFSEYYLKAFKLPILPAYSDYNLKFETKWKRSQLKFIAIGGFDQSRLNLDDANAQGASDGLRYNTGYIPDGDQSVHTAGINFKRFSDFGITSFVASTSYFRNQAIKYFDNSFEQEDLWLDYDSEELANRLRIEQQIFISEGNLKYGISLEHNRFYIDNYSYDIGPDINPIINDYETELNTIEYGGFISYGRKFFNNKISTSGGIRVDASNYGKLTQNPFKQLSPRASITYNLNEKSNISLTAGSYYQLPPTVILGFTEDGNIANKDRVGYINSNQVALGFINQISEDRIFSVEGFYKAYDNYPFLLRDSISFANANADYVAVGNQPATSTSVGRAYGVEIFAQKKFKGNNLYSASYNLLKSVFQDRNGDYVSSSWDTRHFLSLIYARTFGKDWQIGAKFSYASASPYTPYDVEKSSRIDFWELNRKGAFNYKALNSAMLKPFHQLDFRIDKNIYKKKYTANLYLDIQNIYSSAIEFIPYLVPKTGEDGNFLIDPNDASRYQTEIITSDTGRILPTIGIIIEI